MTDENGKGKGGSGSTPPPPPPVTHLSKQLMSGFEKYVPGDDFEEYLELFDNFMGLCNVTENANKLSALLHYIGPETYSTLKKLLKPDKPKEKTFQQNVKALKDHFCPAKHSVVEHFVFNEIKRNEGESVADFIVRLKDQAAKCNFGDFRDTAIRDKIVQGINDTCIQKLLLSKGGDITLEVAIETAVSGELTDKSVAKLNNSEAHSSRQSKDESVNKVSTSAKKDAKKEKSNENSYKSHGKNKDKHNNFYNKNNGKNKGKNFKGKNRNFRNYNDRNYDNNQFNNNYRNYNNNENFKDRRCYVCRNKGHIARDCWHRDDSVKMVSKSHHPYNDSGSGFSVSSSSNPLLKDL